MSDRTALGDKCFWNPDWAEAEIERLQAEHAFERRERIATAKAGDKSRQTIKRLQSRLERMTATHAQDFDDLQNQRESLRVRYVNRCDAHDKLQSRIELLEAVLEEIHHVLDAYLGDTDPNWPSEWTDEEIKEEMPIFWCCRRAAEDKP